MHLVAAATAVTGMAGTVMMAWLRGRVQRHQAREAARRDHVRYLPPGSRIVDLGERAMAIDVGVRAADRMLSADDHR